MKLITSLAESIARVRKLRKAGYRVKVLNLPDGSRVVLKTRKRFTCSAVHHCPSTRSAAPAKRSKARKSTAIPDNEDTRELLRKGFTRAEVRKLLERDAARGVLPYELP